MRTFCISDTHFNHNNIISYCGRPFSSLEEMNNRLITNWNEIVQPDDTVYFLGDFAFGIKDNIKKFAQQLNGQKFIVLGNHDRKPAAYLEASFKIAVESFIIPKTIFNTKLDIVLTHKPIISDNYNIHGHIHDMQLNSIYNEHMHFNASVENIDYKPIDIEKIILLKDW